MKLIYTFTKGHAEGDKSMATVLGGKGANLAEMCKVGLPIPAGLTIPTEACVYYMEYEADGNKPKQNGLLNEIVKEAQAELLDLTKPSDGILPLLSVRSGSRVSMPGMMDTILNVGITVDSLPYWRKELGDRVALDSFRRLIQMFGNVVHGIPNDLFEHELSEVKGKKTDADLTVKELEEVVDKYLALYEAFIDTFPFTLDAQLRDATEAVFKSWNCPRAVKYRQVNKIPDTWGTAVNIQVMVFGNKNKKSGAGVLFSRNPVTGAPGLYGEYLVNAQGEDVVAGIRTPKKIREMKEAGGHWLTIHKEIDAIAANMEKHYREMQDMEFTIDDGELFILQTRSGKRSAAAAFRIAHDLVDEGMITKEEAIQRVTGKQYLVLNKPAIDPSFSTKPALTGLPAAGNIATGVAVFTSAEAEKSKEPCILVTNETTPEDFGGMVASEGILTKTGGATSHAAVVARGMNKSCVVGCTELGGQIKAGDKVTIDGATGRVWINVDVPVIKQKIDEHVATIIEWALAGDGGKTVMRISPEVSSKKNAEWGPELEPQIPKEGYVYVDCGKLEMGGRTRYVVAKLLELLKARPGLHGILGLTRELEVGSEDAKFLEFLCLDTAKAAPASDTDTALLQNQLKALLMKQWTLKMKKNWTVHLPSIAGKLHTSMVTAANWKVVRKVTTLGDLMEVDGMLDVDEATTERLKTEGVELEKFVALLKDAGRTVEPMPEAVTRERMVFEVLGK